MSARWLRLFWARARARKSSPGLLAPELPTGVIFDWPETVVGSGGECKPGHYVGELACRLYIICTDGEGAFDLSGTIDMQLEQTMDGERLRIANGKFESVAAAAISVSADVGIPFTDGSFSGPLESPYDKSTSTLGPGQWNMTGELDGFPGSSMNGTWSAHWVP